MRIGVVANPSKKLGGGLGALREELAARGIAEPAWREPESPEAVPGAVEELVAGGIERLLVWGGDGTVQQCVAAVGDTQVPLAILPAGTGNLLARNLGVPTDLRGAVEVALNGRPRRIDAGLVNGERFAVIAGAGFDAILLDETSEALKGAVGRLAYVAAGFRSITHEPVATHIEVDGAPWFDGPASCVLVGNMGSIMGGLTAFPAAAPGDGLLDVGVITAEGAAQWAHMLTRVMRGHAADSSFVETRQGARITATFGGELPYEIDGDSRAPVTRLDISVQPGAITVCAPASPAG